MKIPSTLPSLRGDDDRVPVSCCHLVEYLVDRRTRFDAVDGSQDVRDGAESVLCECEVALGDHPDDRASIDHGEVVNFSLGDHAARDSDRVVELHGPRLTGHEVSDAVHAVKSCSARADRGRAGPRRHLVNVRLPRVSIR